MEKIEYVDLGEGRFNRITTIETPILASEVEASIASQIADVERQIIAQKARLDELRAKQDELFNIRKAR